MNLQQQTEETGGRFSLSLPMGQNIHQKARILVISEDNSIPEQLAKALPDTHFMLSYARGFTDGCDLARSDHFQVIITSPLLRDGTWKRLIDLAEHYDLGFVVIVMANGLDAQERAEALEYGAFDVLEGLNELPRVAQSVKCAAWAAYLKGAGPRMGRISNAGWTQAIATHEDFQGATITGS